LCPSICCTTFTFAPDAIASEAAATSLHRSRRNFDTDLDRIADSDSYNTWSNSRRILIEAMAARPDSASGTWQAPADQLAQVLVDPCLAELGGLGTIAARGPEAVAFLQSQLTNEIEKQGEDALALNGFCTAKGRLLATFQTWRAGEDVLLHLPRELVAPVLKRLSMFVLRRKARLVDESDLRTVHGLLGPGAAALLAAAGLDAPAEPWRIVRQGGLRIARLLPAPQVRERFLLLAEPGAELPPGLSSARSVGEGVWWWSEVVAAVPTVFAATQERFVPQMINFEVVGGVSFRKGCYPGQEVVARSQYLGKLRRRMALGHIGEGAAACAQDVFAEGAPGPAGVVVMAAAAPGGGTDLLFECPLEAQLGPLRVGTLDGPLLSIRALPYPIVDPTA
jgi:folate-binding protein YgfZ